MKRFFLVALLLACVGCAERDDRFTIQRDEPEWVLAEVFDVGMPYRQSIRGHEEAAFRYALAVKDAFFKGRSEPNDRLLISRLCAQRQGPILDCRPRTFRQTFPDAAAFSTFLQSGVPKGAENTGEIHAYEALAQTLDYMSTYHEGSPNLKSVVIVFSGMENRSPDPEKDRRRLVQSMRNYREKGGLGVGFYWVPWAKTPEIDQLLRDSGVTDPGRWRVPDIKTDPVVLMFE